MKYNVGDKFILEVKAVTHELEEPLYVMNNAAFNRVFEEVQLDHLEQLDSDYINEHFGELQDEAYNKGLEDAWELRNRTDSMPGNVMLEVFGTVYMKKLTFQEALAKIEAYEKPKEEIKVGDMVDHRDFGVVVVTRIEEDGYLTALNDEGVAMSVLRENVKKTGKHIDIQKLLDELKEGADNA